jgi:hypothetical protein
MTRQIIEAVAEFIAISMFSIALLVLCAVYIGLIR